LAAAACDQGGGGSGGGSGGGGTVPYTPPNVYITVDEIGFYPVDNWAEPGARVYFTNDACDDFDGDMWCDWDEELDIYVDAETTDDSAIHDRFITDWLYTGDSVSVRLPNNLWPGDAYHLYAGYSDAYGYDAGSATGWLNIE
jgi:hypothetical protein